MVAINGIQVILEIGGKRVIASALNWPGWCRGGQDEASALQALLEYGPRYAQVLHPAGLEFNPPDDTTDFNVFERLPGNSATDYGVPAMLASQESGLIDQVEMERYVSLLAACWQALERTAQQAAGKELRKGPRGGGRELDQIVSHVLEAEKAYLGSLGFKPPKEQVAVDQAFQQIRQAVLSALAAAVRGEQPKQGPRGGKIWPARYYVRRSAWHILDHLWEIEDRS